jgi:hypothetical protein
VLIHGPLGRVLVVLAALAGAALGTLGGLALGVPGLIAVGLAGTLAGLTTAAVLRESPDHDRRGVVEGSLTAAGLTAAAVLLVAGVATAAGGGVAALLVVSAVGGWLTLRLVRARRGETARGGRPAGHLGDALGSEVLLLPVAQPGGDPFRLRSADDAAVAELPTAALGQEWLRTTAALAGRLDPRTRRAIVDHRQATLDELERRDPAGFARWLAEGPVPGSDPAAFVQDGPSAGTAAA